MRVSPVLLALVPILAKTTPDQETPLISVDVNRVVLYVAVREGKARFVSDLSQDNFSIQEDGATQKIISFSREDVPVAIGLLVDNSQSMMNKRNEVVAAAKAFVEATKPEDELFILHFNERLAYGLPSNVPFTGDRSQLGEALDRMRLDGRTALYDAIHEGLKHLGSSKLTKKALIVLSDGGDNVSLRKAEEVVKAADLSGALFYAIGIYGPMDGDANLGVLRKLAENTGGEAYFPEDLQEVRALCEGIARDLRNQYMLSSAPASRRAKSTYHRIKVKVDDPKRRKLIVRARTGYYDNKSDQEVTER